MDRDSPLLQVECDEPEGKVVRSVRLGQLSFERLKFLWEQLKEFDVLFNDFVRGDFQAFLKHFVLEVNGEPVPAGLVFDIDDVGIFLVNEIRPGESCQVHFMFWDRRFRGREELCRQAIQFAFEHYKFRRIQTEVPLYAKFALRAVERIGFVVEGRLRKAVKYKGDWFDMYVLSLLPEDLEDPTISTRQKAVSICHECGETFAPKKITRIR